MRKRCIIIGNSPISEETKGFGKTIDAYDHVIRMNNFKTDGFEDDLGSKTTIWANGLCDLQGRDLSNIEQVWNVNPLFSYGSGLVEIATKTKKISFVNSLEIIRIYNELGYNVKGFPHPSTGIMTIRLALDKLIDYDIDVFNFSFFSSSVDGTNRNHHYWGEDNGFDQTHKYVKQAHDGEKEKAYLENLIIENNNLKWIGIS